jgi:hypothetical protein
LRNSEEVPLNGIGRIGAEAIAEGKVELFHRPHQRNVSFADQFVKRKARLVELLGDRNNQSQIGRDQNRLDGLRFSQQTFNLLELLHRGPLGVEPFAAGDSLKLQPVHSPEIELLLILGQQPGLVKTRQIRRQRPTCRRPCLCCRPLKRNPSIGRRGTRQPLSVGLKKDIPADILDSPLK